MFGELIEIIVYVEDMAAQVAFYRDVLGLQVTWPDVGNFADEHWVTFATGAATLALHSGGERRQGVDAPKYVFGTGDVDQAREFLAAREIRVSEVRVPAPGVRVFDAWDPEGNVFSVEQQA